MDRLQDHLFVLRLQKCVLNANEMFTNFSEMRSVLGICTACVTYCFSVIWFA